MHSDKKDNPYHFTLRSSPSADYVCLDDFQSHSKIVRFIFDEQHCLGIGCSRSYHWFMLVYHHLSHRTNTDALRPMLHFVRARLVDCQNRKSPFRTRRFRLNLLYFQSKKSYTSFSFYLAICTTKSWSCSYSFTKTSANSSERPPIWLVFLKTFYLESIRRKSLKKCQSIRIIQIGTEYIHSNTHY